MRHLGPYTILEQLGRGGQGVVYLAEDTRLKRKVALKVIETVSEDMPQDRLERFRREAEAASKLDHPNICAIHEAGEVDGVPYIAMRYIEGETLAERIEVDRQKHDSGTDSTPSTRDEIHAILLRVEKVAHALHIAHEQGLIHRDIKPGNVMLTAEDEPVVLDFGLARDEFAGEMSLTLSGDLLGTPAYMSPEQLMAQRIPLDRRTDIYSLGATLYESLTLKRPFEALTRAELYQRIMTDEPSSASSLNRAIPRDLQVVLDTALEKNRDRRYQTAQAFADDLRRVREFEPIHAKPIGRLLRLKRWAQRHPAIASSAVLLTLAFAVTIVLFADTRAALRRSEMLRLVAASTARAERDPVGALRAALAAVDLERSADSVGQVRNALALPVPTRRVALEEFQVQRRLRVTDDRRRMMLLEPAKSRLSILSIDGALVRREQVAKLSFTWIDWGFSPSGAVAFARDQDGGLHLWSAEDGVPIEIPGLARKIGAVRFTTDDRLVVASAEDGRVEVVDVAARSVAIVRPRDRQPGHALEFDPGRHAVIVACGKHLERWPLGVRSEPSLFTFDHAPLAGAIGADKVAGVMPDGSLVFGDFESARQDQALPADSRTTSVRRSKTGTRFVSFHERGPARLWDASGALVATLDRPDGSSLPARQPEEFFGGFSPDGRRLVTIYDDLTVCIWDDSGRHLGSAVGSAGSTNRFIEWSGHSSRVTYATGLGVLVFGRDGGLQHEIPLTFLASGVADFGSCLWVVSGGALLRWDFAELPFRAHDRASRHIDFQGDQILTAGDDGWVRRFRVDGTLLGSHGPMDGTVQCAALSANQRWIAAGTGQGTIALWSVDAAEPTEMWYLRQTNSLKGIAFLDEDPPRLVAVGWHPDAYLCEPGRDEPTLFPLGAQGGGDIVVRDGVVMNATSRFTKPEKTVLDAGVSVWRPGAGLIQDLRMPDRDTGEGLACSADGRILAASASGEIHVWERRSATDRWPEQARVLSGHTGTTWSLDFSADGSRLASCSNDGTARIWAIAEGRCVAILRGHKGAVRGVRFLPGDRQVVTVGVDGWVRRYLVDDDEVLAVARTRVAGL